MIQAESVVARAAAAKPMKGISPTASTAQCVQSPQGGNPFEIGLGAGGNDHGLICAKLAKVLRQELGLLSVATHAHNVAYIGFFEND